jgi:DNA repair ATPase RecN
MLKDPEKIRQGLEALIRQQGEETHENSAKTAQEWEDKLDEYAWLRRAYQDQQAAGLMSMDELRLRLEELDEGRKVAEAELKILRRSHERMEDLKKDRDAVFASLERRIPEALDDLSGEDRNRLYRMLRMEVTPTSEGFEATGVFCSLGPTSRERTPPIEAGLGRAFSRGNRLFKPLSPPKKKRPQRS